MEPRPRSFYILSAFFALFILLLYGPTITIGILSFQGEGGGLTFPLRGVSLYWFYDLFEQQAVGDIWGSSRRSFLLGLMVMVVTVVVSTSRQARRSLVPSNHSGPSAKKGEIATLFDFCRV